MKTKDGYYHIVEYHRDEKGESHCETGPACVWANGDAVWYNHGLFHRLDGPALDWKDRKQWYVNGKLHRIDGPAVIWTLNNLSQWFINGKKLDCKTQEEFEQLMKLKAFW